MPRRPPPDFPPPPDPPNAPLAEPELPVPVNRRRPPEDICDGAAAVFGRLERVGFVLSLVESGEWEDGLCRPLADAWQVQPAEVKKYVAEAGRQLALEGAADAVRASAVARLRLAGRMAEQDPSPANAARALVSAVQAESKMLGLDLPPRARVKDEEEQRAKMGGVPLLLERCGECGEDQLPGKRVCGDCGKPMRPGPAGEPTPSLEDSGESEHA